jgi:hypothetical protein
MNIENIDKTIEAIRHAKEKGIFFDMGMFIDRNHTCGTAACIGGFAAILAKDGLKNLPRYAENIDLIAADFLGLDGEQAGSLFYPGATENGWQASAENAIEVLEHLKETGEANWSRITIDPSDHDRAYQEFLEMQANK